MQHTDGDSGMRDNYSRLPFHSKDTFATVEFNRTRSETEVVENRVHGNVGKGELKQWANGLTVIKGRSVLCTKSTNGS